MCLVSVIIPNYNHAQYLPQRIESVLKQTFEDFEVIILDDCSTDDSRKIIEKYRKHPKVSQIVFNEKNSGNTFKQWNKGFELARGEYIWIAESDDYCEPSLVENLVAGFSKEDVVLSYCQSVCVTDTGKINSITRMNELEQVLDGKEFVLDKMMGGNCIPNASMAMLRKSSIRKIPTDYMKMRFCGDWLFWTHLCMTGKIYISGKFLNYYRRHDNNVTSSAIKEGLFFTEGNEIFATINSLAPSTEQVEKAFYQRIESYLKYRKLFDPSVHELVINSLMKIRPDLKKYLFKVKLKKNVRTLINSF